MAFQLSAKQLFLQIGIIQLGVGVGNFHPLNKQFESFGDLRPIRGSFGQGTDAGGVVQHKKRSQEGVFNFFFEDFVLDHIRVFGRGVETDLVGQLADARVVLGIEPGMFCEQLIVRFSLERGREVDGGLAPGQL